MKRILLILFALTSVFALRAQGDGGSGFNPPSPPDPQPWYRLTVKSMPEKGGTTSPEGNSYHKKGEGLYCYASPHLGYKFRAWMIGDEVVSTDQSFYYEVPEENVVLTAWFDEVEFDPANPGDPFVDGVKLSLSVYASPSYAGNAQSFTMVTGEERVITPSPVEDSKFICWKQGDEVISTDPELTVKMGTRKLEYTAVYEFIPYSPGHPGSEYDDVPMDPPSASLSNDSEVDYGTTVELKSPVEGAVIWYTLDGSDPVSSETRLQYVSPIEIKENLTIKAYVVAEAHAHSEVVAYTYKVKYEVTEDPVASIASGSEVALGTKLELTCSTSGASIWYTIDGSDPVSSSTRQLYSAPIVIDGDMTVKAYAKAEGYYTESGVAIFSYTVKRTVTATPAASIASGSEVALGTKLELTCSTSGASIWYTIDGSDPLSSSTRQLYSAPILIDGDITVKAYAKAEGYYTESGVATFSYTVKRTVTASPVASIESGSEVALGTKLELTCKTSGASIWYTIDGTDPLSSSSRQLYSAPIVIDGDMTVKAYAKAEGYYTESGVATFSYTVSRTVTAVPVASLASGSEVALGTKLELTCSTSGASIWYTIDGSDPVSNSSRQLYSAPIVIDGDMTVKAYAKAEGYYTESGVATFSYTVSRTVTATPVASVASGSEVALGTKLELTCSTSGASIWYTIDGTDPSSSSSRQLYSAPIVIDGDMTVKAYAKAEGYYIESGVATFSYIVKRTVTATPVASVASGSEVALGTKLELTCSTSGASIWYTTDGSDPVSSSSRILYSAPITIDGDMTVQAYAQKEGYYIDSEVVSFTYTVEPDLAVDAITDDVLKVVALQSNNGFIVAGLSGEAVVAVYDMNGKLAMAPTRICGETTIIMDSYLPGIYIVKVVAGNKVATLKFLKD